MKDQEEPYVQYCPTCGCFREGTTEYVTKSERKIYLRFLCAYCLLPSEGFIYKKKGDKPWNNA